jgi:dethiobiotin synthetase
MSKYFITAIDTDAGKTYATGMLAKAFVENGASVITAKLAQTGCQGVSIDIQEHRRLMGTDLLPVDIDGTTCPFVYPFPASPHLSAQLVGSKINLGVIDENIAMLTSKFDNVLLEGVGGLMVPIHPDYLVVDFVADRQLPVILVTSAKLGSINHTLLTLEVCAQRKINVAAIVFNHYPQAPEDIMADTRNMVQRYALRYFPEVAWLELPLVGEDESCVSQKWNDDVRQLL